MRPDIPNIFDVITLFHSLSIVESCVYRNNIITLTLAEGNIRRIITMRPVVAHDKLIGKVMPFSKASYYLILHENGAFLLKREDVCKEKITNLKRLIPIVRLKNMVYKALKNRNLSNFTTTKKFSQTRENGKSVHTFTQKNELSN